jgi:hypothetical protein
LDVSDFGSTISEIARQFWRQAIDPLHGLTWQTAFLLIWLVAFAALIATWMLRVSWRWSKPSLAARKVKPNHHMYPGRVRLSREDCAAVLRLNPQIDETTLASKAAKKFEKYYVLTLVEQQTKRVILYKETRLQLGRRNGTVASQSIQLDAGDLSETRHNIHSQNDDQDGSEIEGFYDVYLRPVQWYDVRHWLLHPNREIRIVVWVTLITTCLPVLLDVLFG